MSPLRSAKTSRRGRMSVSGLDSSRERHFMGSDLGRRTYGGGGADVRSPRSVFHIPGSFIPASRLAKLGLPICLNIFFICAYWRSRLFTSCTVVPEPREIRFRRL